MGIAISESAKWRLYKLYKIRKNIVAFRRPVFTDAGEEIGTEYAVIVIRQSVEYAKEWCERNISVIRENVIVVRIIAPSFTGWYDLSALGD